MRDYLLRDLDAKVFELLVLSDRISFKIQDVNKPLGYLIEKVGVKGVEHLLESNSLEFVLWQSSLGAYYNPETKRGNIVAAQFHQRDPDWSIDQVLKPLSIPDSAKKTISRKARDYYTIPKLALAAQAENAIKQLYESGALASVGLPFDNHREGVFERDLKRLSSMGDSILELDIITQFGYSAWDSKIFYNLFQDFTKRIKAFDQISSDVTEVLKIDSLPSIQDLAFNERWSLTKAIDVRSKSPAVQFRNWLIKTQDNDDKDVVESFLDALEARKSPTFKFMKAATIVGISTALATRNEELAAALAVRIGLVSILSEFGLNLLDSFWVESILKGNNPRLFVKELKRLKNEP